MPQLRIATTPCELTMQNLCNKNFIHTNFGVYDHFGTKSIALSKTGCHDDSKVISTSRIYT